MNAIAEVLQRKTSDFAPAPLAMTAWSFASLQLKNTSLMSSISAEAATKITQFKTQDLAHRAWAVANLRIQDLHLFNILADEIQRNIKGTLPPELANIAWALSKNIFSHEALMSAIATEATEQIRSFKSAEVAMLTWAFAVAGLQNRPLMAEVGAQVAQRMDKFSAPQLSHIAWAFGALSLRHSDFLQALSAHVHGSIASFRAQGLSNIAWAFAMVTFRDEQLLRRVAPEIARDAAQLRPLALARCAWAYRVLAIQSPELTAAIVSEALKKINDFSTKALVKLIDSVYVSPAAAEHAMLENALAARAAEVSSFLKSSWRVGDVQPCCGSEDYATQLQSFGLVDFGLVGTPLLLAQLDVQLPSRGFMQRCRKQPWARSGGDGQRELAVAEVDIAFGERRLHGWVVRPADSGPEAPGAWHEEAARRLLAVDLPGRNGRAEATYLLLEDLAARIFGLGVEPDAAELRAAVHGLAQLLSTEVPSVSSLGTMRQFTTMFPNVTLEFVEQVGAMGD